MNLDLSKTIEPKSDQQNYDDYIAGPKTVTVSEVRKGSSEQPVEIHLVEFPGRPYKPSKSMRRVLVRAWGANPEPYKGRKLRLYGDPTVKFGGQEVGGIKISHLSHISEPVTVSLTVTRSKREPFTVLPLEPESVEPPEGWQDDVAACESLDDLNEFYEMAKDAGWWSQTIAAACTARKEAIGGT